MLGKLQDVMEYLDSKDNLTMDMVLARISKSLSDVSIFAWKVENGYVHTVSLATNLSEAHITPVNCNAESKREAKNILYSKHFS